MLKFGLLFPTLAFIGLAVAQAGPLQETDALRLLDRIATAARELNYSGTFVYQHGQRVETSRIVHFVDLDGEHEKLETLDGPRREVIRNNDEVLCYYPDAKVVRSQQRIERRSFPALLPEQLSAITQFYSVRLDRTERIAGFDSQAVVLEPKDEMRYGRKLWAESSTGLLLKARTLNESGKVVEQFAFTQLNIGAGVNRDMVKPTYLANFPEWRLDKFSHAKLNDVPLGWTVTAFPPGFHKIMEMRRTKQGGSAVTTHMVYSDGMAAISIFVEPASGGAGLQEGLSRQGAINVYRLKVGDNFVTVLGEAPPITVMQIGNSVSFQNH